MTKQTTMWHDDGMGRRARIGLLTPHFDLIPEFEFHAMAPEGVSVHSARVPFGVSGGSRVVGADAARAFAEPPYVDDATELLAAAPIDAIVYGFTSSSYLTGADGDVALKQRLERKAEGRPVVVPCAAAALALRELQVEKLALVNPPWFPPGTDARGAEYFRNQGMDVVHHAPAAIQCSELPVGQLEIEPEQLYDWVKSTVPANADAVLIGGNGFRAIGAIDALETDLQRPVLSANQVAFWQALKLSGSDVTVSGYGRLLEHGE